MINNNKGKMRMNYFGEILHNYDYIVDSQSQRKKLLQGFRELEENKDKGV